MTAKNNENNLQVTRRFYKNTSISLPLLGFGLMRLPQKDGKIDYETAETMVDQAMQAGCNYFDTAYIYHDGESEKFAGKILSKYPRESYYLTDKMPLWVTNKVEDVEKVFNEQLERCQTDYFDFYLLHSVNEDNWKKNLDFHTMEFLQKMKDEGKIKKLGFSFHDTPEFLQKVVDSFPWDFAQIQLNYLDWELYRSREQYEILTEADIPVIIMEPLRGGSLATLSPDANEILKNADPDSSIASWGFRYVASLPNVLCVLSGMSLPEQMADNIKTFAPLNPLTEDERKILDAALETHKKYLAVPCTACRYCMPCPATIDIPKIFALYNRYKVIGGKWQFQNLYKEIPKTSTSAACLSCGKCAQHCPQKIDIPNMLRKIDEELG